MGQGVWDAEPTGLTHLGPRSAGGYLTRFSFFFLFFERLQEHCYFIFLFKKRSNRGLAVR